MIHDADNGGVHGWFKGVEGKGRLFSTDEEDALADPGASRIGRHEGTANGRTSRVERLHHQQRQPRQRRILAGRDDVPDHESHLHDYPLMST